MNKTVQQMWVVIIYKLFNYSNATARVSAVRLLVAARSSAHSVRISWATRAAPAPASALPTAKCSLPRSRPTEAPARSPLSWRESIVRLSVDIWWTISFAYMLCEALYCYSNNPSNQSIALHLLCLTFWLVCLFRALHPFITFATRNLQC